MPPAAPLLMNLVLAGGGGLVRFILGCSMVPAPVPAAPLAPLLANRSARRFQDYNIQTCIYKGYFGGKYFIEHVEECMTYIFLIVWDSCPQFSKPFTHLSKICK